MKQDTQTWPGERVRQEAEAFSRRIRPVLMEELADKAFVADYLQLEELRRQLVLTVPKKVSNGLKKGC